MKRHALFRGTPDVHTECGQQFESSWMSHAPSNVQTSLVQALPSLHWVSSRQATVTPLLVDGMGPALLVDGMGPLLVVAPPPLTEAPPGPPAPLPPPPFVEVWPGRSRVGGVQPTEAAKTAAT